MVLLVNLVAGIAWVAIGFVVAGVLGGAVQSRLAPDDPQRAVVGVAAFAVGALVAGIGIVATLHFTRRFRRPKERGVAVSPPAAAAPPWAPPAEPPRSATAPAAATPGAWSSGGTLRLGEGLTGQGSQPAAARPSRLAGSRWLAVIGAVVAVVTALAAGFLGTILLGMETEGYTVLLSAPVGGFVAGIAAGAIAGRQRIPAAGFVAAVAGFTGGILAGYASWGLAPGGLGSGGLFWLAFLVAITGIPALAGYGIAAAWTLPRESRLRSLLKVLLP